MSWLTGSRNGTSVDERSEETLPLPADDLPSPVGVQPSGSPTDPLGDRHLDEPGPPRRPPAPPGRPPAPPPVVARAPRPRRPVPRTVWFFVVIAVLGLSAALGLNLVIGGLASLNPFKNGFIQQRTVDRSGPA